MSSYIIKGGNKIEGEITPIANKNSVLPIICASVLIDEPVTLTNVPRSLSVRRLLKIFRQLGGKVTYKKDGSVVLNGASIKSFEVANEVAKLERASIMFLGPLLARFGRSKISDAGGCKLGARPVDTLINGLVDLGAEIRGNDIYNLTLRREKKDRKIWLQEASVTGTENLIIAAVLLPGVTEIYNAASEPHVQDLCNFLVSAGAKIKGICTNRLMIECVDSLNSVEWKIISDHIDIGGLIITSAITGGRLVINDAIPEHMYPILKSLEKFNLKTEVKGNKIIVPARQKLECKPTLKGNIDSIKASPWPNGVPADLLPQFVVLAIMSEGSMFLMNPMYENQLTFAEQLQKMGGRVAIMSPHKVMTFGTSKLKGTFVTAPSIIQCAHALTMAGMTASGVTRINNIDSIERRFPNYVERMRSLGASIEEVHD